MTLRRRVALTLLTALLILAFPTAASAVEYEVNSTGDQAAGVGFNCLPMEACTLRSAIELSNISTIVDDEIIFKSSVFDGEKTDSTITVGFSLPPIEDKVTIDGNVGSQAGG